MPNQRPKAAISNSLSADGGMGAKSSDNKAQSSTAVVGTIMLAAIASTFPAFLVGALSVQVSAEFAVAEGRYGLAMGGYFLAAAVGSMMLGRLAQVVGPRNQLSFALAGTAAVQLGLALFARQFWLIIVFLAVAGGLNAAAQTAVNLALTQAKVPRLGLAIAFKQSGMPAASMFAGLAVPVLALTVGWRWAYVLGAAIAVGALVTVRSVVSGQPVKATRSKARPVSSKRALWAAAGGGLFLAFVAGALNAWIVGSGVDAGMDEGLAGVMLSAGAAVGIVARLFAGSRIDNSTYAVFRMAALVLVAGVVGAAVLSFRLPAVHAAATLLAFGGGWIWPVFTNFGIVKTNAEAAAAASGITQTGVYLGVCSGPIVTGLVIERWGYPTMWLLVSASAVIGALILVVLSSAFDVRKS